ncbi:MAG TPA: hypothetical protein VMW69_13065 [Spirochaetia bacterium]|nr:hypothetical protein [Spirochaetia bacterium]
MADNNGTDEYDIQGLEPEDAKRYVVAVMATLQQTTAKRVQLERDLELWQNRVKLAMENGRQDLIEPAERKVAQLQEEISHLRGEEHGYGEGLSRMKLQLKVIQSQPTMSVDVDLLTAQMDMMLGESEKAEAETRDKFRGAEAEAALEELKRKMQEENE